jgi:hypothetical protein
MRAGWTLRLAVVMALTATIAFAAPAYGTSRRAPALTPAPRDALSLALATGRLTAAEYALERARSLFSLTSVRARYGLVARPGPHDATLILRDLLARLHELSPAEQIVARRIVARPTDPSDPFGNRYSVDEAPPYCTTNVCVHYVTSSGDAPLPTDVNADGVPDWIESTGAELEVIWAKEVVEYGFRPPKSDLTSTNHGPDERIDIYIADVGSDRLYGYCTSDDPNLGPLYPFGDVSAYCVLDNDYAPSQFPVGAAGLQALQVTAAHEFFHAVQSAYDFFDDLVLLEGTAVWMEDEVYDDINDNYQYLKASALARPDVPFDLALTNFSNDLAGFQYGAFVFFRFLTERLEGPEVIRRTWELADASPTGPDLYSLEAVDAALQEHAASFRGAFADFGTANAFPAASYEEGADYPTPPLLRQVTLTAAKRSARGSAQLDHLTSSYVSFRPGTGVRPNARLRIVLNLPQSLRGSEATLVRVARNGTRTVTPLDLNGAGDVTRTIPFGKTRSVVLVLTNASARYQCWVGSPFACSGVPRDDDLVFRYEAALLQPR